MTTLAARSAPIRSRSTEILCTGNLSIVLEGVDGEPTLDGDSENVFDDDLDTQIGSCQDLTEGGISLMSTPRGSRRGSRASAKEETEIKLASFKVEAAARLSELERLLDEHDQIIRDLKRSESTGGLHVVGLPDRDSGTISAPNPATPVGGVPSIIVANPSIVISRTAPSSPAITKVRPPE